MDLLLLSLKSNRDWFLVSLFIYSSHDFLDRLSFMDNKENAFPSFGLHIEGFSLNTVLASLKIFTVPTLGSCRVLLIVNLGKNTSSAWPFLLRHRLAYREHSSTVPPLEGRPTSVSMGLVWGRS